MFFLLDAKITIPVPILLCQKLVESLYKVGTMVRFLKKHSECRKKPKNGLISCNIQE